MSEHTKHIFIYYGEYLGNFYYICIYCGQKIIASSDKNENIISCEEKQKQNRMHEALK